MNNFRNYDHDFGSAKEACRFYDVCSATLHRWVKAGRIRYRTGLGGRNRQYELVSSALEKKQSEDNVEA